MQQKYLIIQKVDFCGKLTDSRDSCIIVPIDQQGTSLTNNSWNLYLSFNNLHLTQWVHKNGGTNSQHRCSPGMIKKMKMNQIYIITIFCRNYKWRKNINQINHIPSILYVPFSADCAHLIVDLTNESIGSIHFLRRGSSRGKRSSISSEARITEFTALTKRTWRAILNRLRAPSMSFLFKASIAGITVCSIVALSGSTTSNPYILHIEKKIEQ